MIMLLLLLQLSSHPLSPGKQYSLTYDLTLAPSTKDAQHPLYCVFLFVRPYGTNCLVTFEQDTKISNSKCDCCKGDKRDGLITDNGWYGYSSNLLLTHHLGKLEYKLGDTLLPCEQWDAYVWVRWWKERCSVSHVYKSGRLEPEYQCTCLLFLLAMTTKPQPVAVETPTQGEASYEETHVHQVYEEIATHFSETRYKVCFSLDFIQQRLWIFIRCDRVAMACGRDISPWYAYRKCGSWRWLWQWQVHWR